MKLKKAEYMFFTWRDENTDVYDHQKSELMEFIPTGKLDTSEDSDIHLPNRTRITP
jgi:hypothetical protein